MTELLSAVDDGWNGPAQGTRLSWGFRGRASLARLAGPGGTCRLQVQIFGAEAERSRTDPPSDTFGEVMCSLAAGLAALDPGHH
jgi:hypothetical protein